ncbi:pyridoxamine 5'-phosphate oxidase family protein [Streptomyces platensis]|uniref:pyridoxamine 5'-phosphate oxidase family protein n=1 Tax=Streptomyces platensis TaxID=58346 RepID=UPI002E26F808
MPAADRRVRPGSDGEHELQERMGTTARADRFYDEQVLDRLNTRMRDFVARQEMCFLATSDRHGECDSTFRAGPPGFLHVLDDRTLIYPEYRGNGVLASLGNIEENPHVGILMIDFLRDRIGLHINGRARIVSDEEMRRARPELPVDPVPGRRAQLWVEITVEEAYIHCAKHIPHLQKASAEQRQRQAWGADGVKRKGGDFFGAAADAPDRPPYQPRRRKRCVPSWTQAGEPTRAAVWQRSVQRLLAAVARRSPQAEEGAEESFRGWFC